MADNTEQYQWIAKLVTNLKQIPREQTAFVAGDLLWYSVPVQQDEQPPCQAPDVLVALGRPQGRRGSYHQWEEDGIAPQVVFEIISPSNTAREMAAKQSFYIQYGVLEFYFYDPDSHDFWGMVRHTTTENLQPIMSLNLPWVSPLLGVRFEMFEEGLAVYYPSGELFKDPEVLERDQAQAKLERAIAKLQAAGLDVSDLS
jgi:Uma2 family endonuclease